MSLMSITTPIRNLGHWLAASLLMMPLAVPRTTDAVETTVPASMSALGPAYNYPPVPMDQVVEINENTTATITLEAWPPASTYPGGISFYLLSWPEHGTTSQNNEVITFIPDAGWTGTTSCSFKAMSLYGSGYSSATLTIVVKPVILPVAVADAYTTKEDVALTVPAPGILANDIDADRPSDWKLLVNSYVTPPQHGTLSLASGGNFVYRPAADWNGTDTFTYTAWDTHQGVASAPATVTITVTPVADAPRAVADSYMTTTGRTLTVTVGQGVLANDVEPDGQVMTASLKTGVTHGTLTLAANGSFIYVPASGYVGNDGFSYTVTDGTLSSTGLVTLLVNPLSSTGVSLVRSDATAAENMPTDTASFRLYRTSPDLTSPLPVTIAWSGTATCGVDYRPLPSVVTIPAGAVDTLITVTPIDDDLVEGSETVIGTIVPTSCYSVAKARDQIVILDDEKPLVTPSLVDGIGTENSSDGITLRLTRYPVKTGGATLVVTPALSGTATLGRDYQVPATSCTFTGTVGSITFSITRLDEAQVEGTETIVLSVPDAPGYEGGAPVTARLLDDEKPEVSLTVTDGIVAEPSDVGIITVTRRPVTARSMFVRCAASGSLHLIHPPDGGVWIPANAASATITLAPSTHAEMELGGTVTIRVVPRDDLQPGDAGYEPAGVPAVVTILPNHMYRPADVVAGTRPGLDYAFFTTPSAAPWTRMPDVSLLTPVKTGTVTMPDLSPRPQANYYAGVFTGYLEIPTEGAWTFSTTSDDGSRFWIGDQLAVDNGYVAREITSPPASLRAGKHAIRLEYFQYNGLQSLSLSWQGPGVAKQIIPAARFFRAVQSPVGLADAYQVPAGQQLVVNAAMGVLSNDTDPEGHPLNALAETLPDGGNFVGFSYDGGFTFNAPARHGSVTFTYRATNGVTSTAPITVTITVTPVPPRAVADRYMTTTGQTFTVPALQGVLANDVDPEGQAMTASLKTGAAHGTVTLAANGSFTYVSTSGYVGNDVFTYTVTDGVLSATGTVTVLVNPLSLTSVGLVHVDATAAENIPTDTATFRLYRSSPDLTSPLPVTIAWSGTATYGVDYQPLPMVVTIPAGALDTIITVTPIDDDLVEGSETVVGTLVPAMSYFITKVSDQIVILDDEKPRISPALVQGRGVENIPNSIVLRLVRYPVKAGGATLTVTPRFSGTALNNFDYYPINWPTGDVTFTGTVANIDTPLMCVDNYRAEGTKTIVLSVPGGPDYEAGAPVTALLGDDERPEVSLKVTDGTAGEPDNAGVITVSRWPVTAHALPVLYTVSGSLDLIQPLSGVVYMYGNLASVTIPIDTIHQTVMKIGGTVTVTLKPGKPGPEYDPDYSKYDPVGGPGVVTILANHVYRPADVVAGTRPGLDYSFFTTTSAAPWTKMPDVSQLTPVKTGAVTMPDLNPRPQANDYAVVFTGYLQIPTEGAWTFSTNSDDGSRFWIGDQLGVNNDGSHAAREITSQPAFLRAGKHAIRLEYFQYNGLQSLSLSWQGPGVAKQIIPAARFFRAVQSPVGIADAYQVTAGQQLVVNAAMGVLRNDTDPEGHPLSAILETAPASGYMPAWSYDGSFTFEAPAGDGPVTFTYRASNGMAISGPITVTIMVRPPSGVADAGPMTDEGLMARLTVADPVRSTGVLDRWLP